MGNKKNLKGVDLFAAPGGLSLGIKWAGFEIVCAVDKDKSAAKTYAHNFPETDVVAKDVRDLPKGFFEKYGDIDLVAGGPPCQGFSLAGKRDPKDERNNMVFQFIEKVDEINPKWVLMENVYGLASMKDGKVVKEIQRRFENIGYYVKWKILNAAKYGVPQKRKRLFCLGNRTGDPITFPKPTHGPHGQTTLKGCQLRSYKTVREAFEEMKEDLPNQVPPNHSEEMVEKISEVKRGDKLYPSRAMGYYRLEWDSPSWAVAIAGGGEGLIHPSEDRVITVREAARLQTFPDSFIFKGTRTENKQQVSNAVPPKLAKILGLQIKKELS